MNLIDQALKDLHIEDIETRVSPRLKMNGLAQPFRKIITIRKGLEDDKGTVFHEIGHVVISRIFLLDRKMYGRINDVFTLCGHEGRSLNVILLPLLSSLSLILPVCIIKKLNGKKILRMDGLNPNDFISQYAQTSVAEDFCETFAAVCGAEKNSLGQEWTKVENMSQLCKNKVAIVKAVVDMILSGELKL